jgi:Mce-associated membrane protein
VDTGRDGWEHPGMTTVGAEGPPTAAPPGAGPHVVPPWSGPRSSSTPPGSRRPPAVDGPFTPERPKASWGVRVIAVLLDSAVVATIVWFATGASVGLATLPLWGGDEDPLPAGTGWWTGGTLLALAVLQAYTGMTPGKRAAGIAVVDAGSGRPIGLAGTILRWLAHFLDAFLMIGYLRAAWHREGRTFADSLLGTVVVRSTRPRPHPWVMRVRRVAPRLTWPSWITSVAALVVCALAAAACLVTGGGSSTGAAETASCRGDGPLAATAFVESTTSQRWSSRLGIRRVEEPTTMVVAGWTADSGLNDDGDSAMGEDTVAALSLRSPDGLNLSSTADGGGAVTGDFPSDGAVYLEASLPEPVGPEVGVETPYDVAGWTAHAVLTSADGTLLADCVVPVPVPAPVLGPW